MTSSLRIALVLATALSAAACAGTPRDGGARSEPVAPAGSTEPVRLEPPSDAATEGSTDAGPGALTPDAGAAQPDSGAEPAAEADAPPPPPAGKRYRPLGACVDPVEHAKRLMLGPPSHAKASDFVAEPMTGSAEDLDGDGEPDQLLVGNVANVTTTYYVYVMRGKCGHFAGRIDSVGRLEPVGGYTRGLRGLGALAPCQPACCKDLMYSEYHYDGTRFKLAKKELRHVSDCPFHGI